MRKTADVIIIGSGVIGCATAYELEKKATGQLVKRKANMQNRKGSAKRQRKGQK